MIVCICNNVSDQKIRQAVDSGITSMTELRDHLDVGTSCGKCHACAKRVLRECLADASQTKPMLFQRNILAA
jgi:bacterioferritin-associated ferredoxin